MIYPHLLVYLVFKNNKFKAALKEILGKCKKFKKPAGIHVVEPSVSNLRKRIKEGTNFFLWN